VGGCFVNQAQKSEIYMFVYTSEISSVEHCLYILIDCLC